MAAVVAAIPLTTMDAAARGGGGARTVQRAPVFRPPPRQTPRFTQTHVNRGTGGRHHNAHTPHGNPKHHQNTQGNQQANTSRPQFTPKPGTGGTAQAFKLGPGKPVIHTALKPLKPAFPVVTMHNKFWPILKGPKFIWFAGQRRFFISVGVLGVVLIGDSYWYPDGYVSIMGPACTGFTPDGCQLRWRMVDFEDGGSAAQCVQYCPQSGPPPAKVATLPPPPVLAQAGNCQLTIYAEAEFAGLAAPTTDNQPLLSETGWKDEISSIQVQAGTWDFFSAENFGGESIRMAAGSYPMLTQEWNKRIGSFMCVDPGASGT
jgi:hypothetical protein